MSDHVELTEEENNRLIAIEEHLMNAEIWWDNGEHDDDGYPSLVDAEDDVQFLISMIKKL